MTNFIKDNTSLRPAKSDHRVNLTVPPDQQVAAVDWNEFRQSFLDIQSYLRAATWIGFDDQSSDPAPAGIDSYIYVSAGGSLMIHHGGTTVAVGGGGGGDAAKQVFRYTANGAEANPVTISLPSPRADANYNVQITLRRPGANSLKTFSVVDGTQTTTQFGVEGSVKVQNGDILMFTVEDPT